jgi:hypothetical protein
MTQALYAHMNNKKKKQRKGKRYQEKGRFPGGKKEKGKEKI